MASCNEPARQTTIYPHPPRLGIPAGRGAWTLTLAGDEGPASERCFVKCPSRHPLLAGAK